MRHTCIRIAARAAFNKVNKFSRHLTSMSDDSRNKFKLRTRTRPAPCMFAKVFRTFCVFVSQHQQQRESQPCTAERLLITLLQLKVIHVLSLLLLRVHLSWDNECPCNVLTSRRKLFTLPFSRVACQHAQQHHQHKSITTVIILCNLSNHGMPYMNRPVTNRSDAASASRCLENRAFD